MLGIKMRTAKYYGPKECVVCPSNEEMNFEHILMYMSNDKKEILWEKWLTTTLHTSEGTYIGGKLIQK